MTKILKKFTLAIVTVCLIITGVFAAACNPEAIEPEDPAKDGYTITVLYPDGTPVKASDTGNSRRPVRVKLTDDDGNNVIPNYDSQNMGILNDYGTTTLNYKVPGEFNIAFIWLPEGY
ncbi:MAG: hypothetical protein K2K80_05775, partial [Clostridia bacterium]|nr:hypothetical protein [Clostridia bacterium]